MLPLQHPQSVILLTLDSCRYDTFVAAEAPNLKAIGPVHQAMAPGNYTYSSHCSIFVGYTPGVAQRQDPHVNPKIARLFRLSARETPAKENEHFVLNGRNIIDGFRQAGYLTLGTAGVRWFDPGTTTARTLIGDFGDFGYFGYHHVAQQVEWVQKRLPADGRRVFLFMNIGETHVPYWHEGADWPVEENPCRPYATTNDAQKCRQRQKACLEYVDKQLAPVLQAFGESNIIVCGDHGDAWGEDGLWEHCIHHEKVLEVPLVYRLAQGLRDDAPKVVKLPTSFREPRIIVRR